jgi:hypothetical protein
MIVIGTDRNNGICFRGSSLYTMWRERDTKERGIHNHLALPGRPLTLIHCCCKAMYEVAALYTSSTCAVEIDMEGKAARVSHVRPR